MAAELNPEAGVGRAPAHHAVGVDAVHRLVGEHAGFAERRAEEGGLAVLADAGRGEILIEELFELVMRRHFVALAAFLAKAPTSACRPGNSPRPAWQRRRRREQTCRSSPPSARGRAGPLARVLRLPRVTQGDLSHDLDARQQAAGPGPR